MIRSTIKTLVPDVVHAKVKVLLSYTGLATTFIALRALRPFLIRGYFSINTLYGKPSKAHNAVVMCTWRRINRLPETLCQLDAQGNEKVDVFLWNNNFKSRDKVNKLASTFTATGGIRSISVCHSVFNVGGMGRFFLIRKLLNHDLCGIRAIMLDDDQDISSSFISDLNKCSGSKIYASLWAYKLGKSYWANRVVPDNGGSADYCGTGGSVIDTSVFKNKSLFKDLPIKYWFVEDLWLSFFVKSLGWRLKKVDTIVDFVDIEQDSYHRLSDTKEEFYRRLRGH
jgi:hypothetical protein